MIIFLYITMVLFIK